VSSLRRVLEGQDQTAIIAGDCRKVLALMPDESIDAVVCDPPYGLEFMGRGWDTFREDDPGTSRNRGEHAGIHGEVGRGDGSNPARSKNAAVAYGGGKRATTSWCTGCGKRDQFRNPHGCPEGAHGARWAKEIIDPHAAPPTSLAFQNWVRGWAAEALRVLKPGGHIVAFGGTRVFHRLTAGLEDAGFEVRDCLMWLYGTGFPKSLDVAKAIDKAAGAKREVVGTVDRPVFSKGRGHGKGEDGRPVYRGVNGGHEGTAALEVTAPATPEAVKWQGWGTALKPAWEPIVLARKPIPGTVIGNVLEFGVGALNVDGTRIGTAGGGGACPGGDACKCDTNAVFGGTKHPVRKPGEVGRWPANVVLSHGPGCRPTGETRDVKTGTAVNRNHPDQAELTYEPTSFGIRKAKGDDATYGKGGLEPVEIWDCAPGCAIAELDAQAGAKGGGFGKRGAGSTEGRTSFVLEGQGQTVGYGDGGGASRFFYCAKASRAERERGLEALEAAPLSEITGRVDGSPGAMTAASGIGGASGGGARKNTHPTVKPLALMRWLVRLVTPVEGVVLDPFSGSGSTIAAAAMEGFRAVGIEKQPEFAVIARARVAHHAPSVVTEARARALKSRLLG